MKSKNLKICTEIINEDYPDGIKAVFKITRIFEVKENGTETPVKFSAAVELVKSEKNKEVA